ncbi:MAG: pseudouridine-5'-phosphate glycosidase [Ruthenibacterium sp.]
MNLREYLHIAPEVSAALKRGRPVVALESAILSHGVPYPENSAFAAQLEELLRAEGVVPATTAVLDGVLRVGLSPDERARLCRAEGTQKATRRDLPILVAAKRTGATTVAGAMVLASLAGIRVLATGGIGGVQRGADSLDISADLQELAQTPVSVVCAGAKMFFDIGRTLEYLETAGVPVLGLDTEDFPAFYCRSSGFPVDYNAKTPAAAAAVLKAKWALGLKGGVLIANPVPEACAMEPGAAAAAVDSALRSAFEAGVRGSALSPYLLARVAELTNGAALQTNIQLAYSNARAAGRIAAALAQLRD